MRIPQFRTALAGSVCAFVLTACGGATGSGDVLPIDEILATDIALDTDASGTFAVLEVTTNLDVACAVVYGTTEDFGMLATDDDMGGAAHSDHSARLRGLEPETTYYYRLQGSDADGNLYRSETMTFTTPAASQPDVPGENIAPQGMVVGVSSEFSDAFAAANAIDGDLATEWSTAGDGDDASITIDLGETRQIVGIGFRSREMTDGTAIIQEYTITVDDGQTYGPFPAGTGLTISEVDLEGQVVRVDASTTTGGNTGAVEIELYAG